MSQPFNKTAPKTKSRPGSRPASAWQSPPQQRTNLTTWLAIAACLLSIAAIMLTLFLGVSMSGKLNAIAETISTEADSGQTESNELQSRVNSLAVATSKLSKSYLTATDLKRENDQQDGKWSSDFDAIKARLERVEQRLEKGQKRPTDPPAQPSTPQIGEGNSPPEIPNDDSARGIEADRGSTTPPQPKTSDPAPANNGATP